eukprot:357166-Chlamydomonas_euryale.AAC.2
MHAVGRTRMDRARPAPLHEHFLRCIRMHADGRTRMDCPRPSLRICWNAASAMAYTCGESSPNSAPRYWSIMCVPYRCARLANGFTAMRMDPVYV